MSSDPYDIHNRMERQIDLLLKEMEEEPERFAFKERLALVTTLGMYLTRNIKLSAADESVNAGSAVRKYSGAFKTSHVAGGGKTGARRPDRAPSRPALAYSEPDSDEPDSVA
jgi:hypothetical protein